MSIVRANSFIANSAGCFISLAWQPAHSQTSLPPAIDAFVTASNALAKAAGERVDLGRASDRMNLIRSSLSASLLARPLQAKITVPVDLAKMLCDARVDNIEVAARRNFIQSVAARVDEVGKPAKIDNLETAFQSLFNSQSLDISVSGLPTADALAAAKTSIRQRCEQDLQTFPRAYYGSNLGIADPQSNAAPAEVVPVFLAIGALIDTITKIITPVVVEGAKIVDEQRRRDAILSFLTAPGNITRIQDSGIALSKQISLYTWDKRLKLAGSITELATVVRNAQIDLTKDEGCKKLTSASGPLTADGKSASDDYIMCYRFAWSQIESSVAALLKTADQYDQLADAGDTDNARKAFEPLAKSLQAVSAPGDDGLIKFWNWAIRLVGFAQKVETAFSSDSRAKINKAIDDLVKNR